MHRIGKNTIELKNRPGILSSAAVTGPKEGRGPYGQAFDMVLDDPLFGQQSYEQAEHAMFQKACEIALDKANMKKEQVQALLGGDLLNQIMAASLAARELAIPFLGLYGACSTMAESLALGAILVDGGYMDPVLCAAGSHYCTAERQYRFPLEYGNQRTMASQWTVTGAGSCVLTCQTASMIKIPMVTIGRVVDMGVSDANNMGAAMAPEEVILTPGRIANSPSHTIEKTEVLFMEETKKPYAVHLIVPPAISGLLIVLEALMRRERSNLDIIRSISHQDAPAASFFEETVDTVML